MGNLDKIKTKTGINKALHKALEYSVNGEIEKSKIVLETIKIIETYGI